LLKTPLPVGLHTFPSDDGAFRLFVEDEFARLGGASLDELQSALRIRYPFAIVRLRSELATFGKDGPLWYAFRRGFGDPPSDRWWDRVAAWATIAADRTFVAVTDAFAAILEVPIATVIGLRIEELANPDDPTATLDVSALWTELLSRGFADGTLRFNRLDGTPREIEYHIARDPNRTGTYRAAIREP
jgi:PAS domain-containing protein